MKKLITILLLITAFSGYAQQEIYKHLVIGDVKETGVFVDSLMNSLIKKENVKGAVVAIVKDGALFYSNGYGYTDLNNKIPVTAENTLFRAASVSKVVTASVVMQLVMQGRLDLYKDVNTYLKDFKIPEAYGKPITLYNLLTHTAGFDDKYIGKSAKTVEGQGTLKDFVKNFMPERILPPGEVFIYSNYSSALAAYLVEAVTGVEFAEYASKYFFLPLGMTKSFYRDPVNKQGLNFCGVFSNENGKMIEYPFDYLKDYPAGQLLTTGNDMAKFIMLHANSAAYQNVLSLPVIEMMQETRFTHDRRLMSSTGLSFAIDSLNGEKAIMHDGGYLGVSSRLVIFPALKFGFYLATNTPSGGVLWNFTTAFLNKYLPYESKRTAGYPLKQLPEYNRDIDKFVGSYRFARYSHYGFEKIGLLSGFMGGDLPLDKNEDGMLLMYDENGKERRLIQVEPGYFISIDDNYSIKFRLDENGKVTHLFTNGVAAFEKVPYLETLPVQHNILMVSLLVFILSFFGSYIRKIYYSEKEEPNTYNDKLYKYIKYVSSAFTLHLAGLGIIFFLLIPGSEMMFGFLYGFPKLMYFVQLFPIAGIALLLFNGIYTAVNFNKFNLKVLDKSALFLFFAVSLTYIWFLWAWNLLGFRW